MGNVITLDQANFDAEVLDSDQPVLVDYRADWWGPCRAVEPILEAIAAERSGELKVGKVDVDEEPGLAKRAGAFSIPYLVLYRDGASVTQMVGAPTEGEAGGGPGPRSPAGEGRGLTRPPGRGRPPGAGGRCPLLGGNRIGPSPV